jgi:hypothetical protein
MKVQLSVPRARFHNLSDNAVANSSFAWAIRPLAVRWISKLHAVSKFGQLCSEGLTRFFRHPGQATNYVSQLLDLPYLRAAKSDCDHGDASTASDIVWVVATLASTCCQSRARSVKLSRLAHEFNRAEMADGRVLANRVAEVAYFLGCETNGPNLTLRACQESTALID